MKSRFRTFTIVALSLSCAACQTTPKAKPLIERSDAARQAIYVTGPVNTPKKERPIWKKAFIVTGVVIVAIPIAILTGLARSGSQK